MQPSSHLEDNTVVGYYYFGLSILKHERQRHWRWLTDVLTWVVVEQHQAGVSVPNSSGLSAWSSSSTSVLPNDAGELHRVTRWDGQLCLGHQTPRTASVNLGTPHPNTEYTLGRSLVEWNLLLPCVDNGTSMVVTVCHNVDNSRIDIIFYRTFLGCSGFAMDACVRYMVDLHILQFLFWWLDCCMVHCGLSPVKLLCLVETYLRSQHYSFAVM